MPPSVFASGRGLQSDMAGLPAEHPLQNHHLKGWSAQVWAGMDILAYLV